ncbi:hypothetical protein FDECE_8479 [Fusarium decemcellulare]|nr:hypothetical protein FDECE_8479 [Fusarium decemcellulare]
MKFSTITTLVFINAGVSLAAPGGPTLTERAITSLTGDNGITTPLPIQPGMVDNCNAFYFVKKGDDCARVSRYAGITFEQFKEWNPSVGDECFGLWADANVCIRTIGYVPPTSAACFGGDDIKPWGKNKADALDAAKDWCYNKGGAQRYDIDQKKTACIDAPSGDGKFNFAITNEHGRSLSVPASKCEYLLALPINGCEEGGQGKTESWLIETYFETGKC